MRFYRREQIIFYFILLYFTEYSILLLSFEFSTHVSLKRNRYTEGLEAKAVCVAKVP